MFNDKIANLIDKKKLETSVPFVEKVFEIIEMLLAFLSNTISFLRLAAFSINHAGLCMAVYLLANMTSRCGKYINCCNWEYNSASFRRIDSRNTNIKTRIL